MSDARSARRRFIAGAVCPDCRAVDRIVLEDEGEVRRRRCVACGHTDQLVREAAVEPATRLTRHRESGGAATSAPVRIIDPGDADR